MRYQHTSPGSRFGFTGLRYSTPQGVKLLLILNIVIFFLIELLGHKHYLFLVLGLIPAKIWQSGFVWQLVTYLFLHAILMHLAVNMFVLWMFGRELEHRWGKHKFLKYYFITGVGSGLITFLFSLTSVIPVVGASGAIYGLLLAYGLLYPDRTVYLYMFIPIKVKFMVIGLAVIAFLASLSHQQSAVSHLTHLSGMVVGFAYLKSDFRFRNIKHWFLKYKPKVVDAKPKKKTKKSKVNQTLLQKRVDEILDKLAQNGWDGLTDSEKNILHSTSKKFTEKQPPN